MINFVYLSKEDIKESNFSDMWIWEKLNLQLRFVSEEINKTN